MYVVFSMCGMSVFHQACAYIFFSIDIFLVSGEAPFVKLITDLFSPTPVSLFHLWVLSLNMNGKIIRFF